VSVMSAQFGSGVHMPDGYWINRCSALVTSDYHDWLYLGGLVAIT
jgi:hypothetical protein